MGSLFSILLSCRCDIRNGPAFAGEPITLRDMGSFHVGGRVVEISGKPRAKIVFGAGGVPAKIDPNGLYQGRADVCAVLPAAEPARASIRC